MIFSEEHCRRLGVEARNVALRRRQSAEDSAQWAALRLRGPPPQFERGPVAQRPATPGRWVITGNFKVVMPKLKEAEAIQKTL